MIASQSKSLPADRDLVVLLLRRLQQNEHAACPVCLVPNPPGSHRADCEYAKLVHVVIECYGEAAKLKSVETQCSTIPIINGPGAEALGPPDQRRRGGPLVLSVDAPTMFLLGVEVRAELRFPGRVKEHGIDEPTVGYAVVITRHVRVGLGALDMAVAWNRPLVLARVAFRHHLFFVVGHGSYSLPGCLKGCHLRFERIRCSEHSLPNSFLVMGLQYFRLRLCRIALCIIAKPTPFLPFIVCFCCGRTLPEDGCGVPECVGAGREERPLGYRLLNVIEGLLRGDIAVSRCDVLKSDFRAIWAVYSTHSSKSFLRRV